MTKHASTTAVLLVAILVAGGSITAIASTGSSPGTNPAPVTTPYRPAFDPANFGGPIDNPWLPLKPGTVLRYRGVGDDGKTRGAQHRQGDAQEEAHHGTRGDGGP